MDIQASRLQMTSTIFTQLCTQSGLPKPVPEFRFHPTRKWRFDYAFLEDRIALEVEGGIFSGGRHTRGSGFVGDMVKYNAAGAMGWIVLRCQPNELLRTATIEMIRQAIATRKAA